jgi:molybdate transport system substrate-binding protein
MIKLIKVLFFATLIIPSLAISEKAQVIVFAAASTKNALDAIIKDYNALTKTEILPVYGSSATLAKQIEFGAPADIFLSANVPWVDHLIERDIIQAKNTKNILNNKLALITTDQTIQEIEDLASTDFSDLLQDEKIVMGMVSSVPAGIYSKQALKYLNQWNAISSQVIQADNVRTALQYLLSRNAVFAIVYASDAKLFPELKIIGIFDDFTHDPIIYPASLINLGSEEADLFFKYLSETKTLKVFREYGFLISGRD